VLQVEVWQLHLSRPGPMATSTTPQPYTADRPENSTTSVDANNRMISVTGGYTPRRVSRLINLLRSLAVPRTQLEPLPIW